MAKRVKMSVCLPVTVDLVVEPGDEWTESKIISVVDARIDVPSPRAVTEALCDADWEHLEKLAVE